MKPNWPRILTWGSVGLVLALVVAKPATRLFADVKHTMRTETFLVIQNNRLYHLTQKFAQAGKYRLIEASNQKDFDASVGLIGGDYALQIHDKGKFFSKPGMAQNLHYSASTGRLYFTEIEPTTKTNNGKAVSGLRLWNWDKTNGFKPIPGVSNIIGEPCLSLDEKQFLVSISEVSGHFTHYRIDTTSGKMTPYALPGEISDPDALIDSDTVLFGKADKVPTREEPVVEANRQLWVFHRSTNRMERLMPTHNLERAIVFQGKIWAINNQNGKEQVVQLNKDLNHIEKTIEIGEVR